MNLVIVMTQETELVCRCTTLIGVSSNVLQGWLDKCVFEFSRLHMLPLRGFFARTSLALVECQPVQHQPIVPSQILKRPTLLYPRVLFLFRPHKSVRVSVLSVMLFVM